MAKKFDWKKYESALSRGVEKPVLEVMGQYPDEHFYGAAFHSFYREHGDRINLPCLSVNTEEEIDEAGDARWSSPDWYWDDLEYESSDLIRQHELLNQFASSLDDEHWEVIHTQWMGALVRVAKQLSAKLKKQKQATKDFGFFLFDEESDEMIDLLRRCMTPAKFKKLFPDLLKEVETVQSVEKLPASKKVAVYAADLSEENCEKLLGQGAKAIPVLINLLDGEDGMTAVRLLGRLGIKNKDVLIALKKYLSSASDYYECFHAARSLALLGETDYLLAMAKKEATRKVAIDGIKSLYSYFTDHSVVYVPLDYGPLEQLLEIDACRKPAQKLPTGNAPFKYALGRREIVAADVEEAIRGTASRYKMIREHAVNCLGNSRIGKASSERAMQAIIDRFEDRAVTVRFLAAIDIRYWKKAAKDHAIAIRRLVRKDPDPDVRDAARRTLRELGL